MNAAEYRLMHTLAPGDSRTISGINFTALSGGEDGRVMSFTDDLCWR